MKYISIFLLFFIINSCSLNSKKEQLKEYERVYRVIFISQAYYKYLDDKIWKDRISCYNSPIQIKYSEYNQINSLVDSLGVVFNAEIADATNGEGSMETHELKRHCVMKRIMDTANSEKFRKIAKQYALKRIK
ncbi:MAG TPA: hypothetical protein VK169_13305 [Saprospiraceae bacterium]|nr:hypothetical protein [Saprospiraceae bacterium]